VGDQNRLVHRTASRLTKEPDGVRPDGLDGLCPTINFLNIYTWRKVARSHRRRLLARTFGPCLKTLLCSFYELARRGHVRIPLGTQLHLLTTSVTQTPVADDALFDAPERHLDVAHDRDDGPDLQRRTDRLIQRRPEARQRAFFEAAGHGDGHV